MTINELALQVVEAMKKHGYSEQTAWGLYADSSLRIVKFHEKCGKTEYDSEVMRKCMRVCDIKFGKTPTVKLNGKGSKIRTVPFMNQTVLHLKNYIEIFHPDENEYSQQYLFYSVIHGKKSPIHDSTARRIMYAYGESAKEKCPEIPDNIHPHLLRHSRAMHLYQHGMDLTLVSQWLGHAQLDTTLIYAHADTEHKRRAIESATDKDSPLRKLLINKINRRKITEINAVNRAKKSTKKH